MVSAHWLSDDKDGGDTWATGELLQFIERGSEVYAVVTVQSGRVFLIPYEKVRIGNEFER